MKIKMNNAVGPQVRSAKPKPSKLLPTLGVLSLAGGLQASTQFFAHTFQYQVRWSRFPRQGHKVDLPMKRTIQHEDTQTVYGRVQGQGCA